MGQRNDNGSPTNLQYIIYIYNENIFDGVFFRKEIFFYYMRVIWVTGRTWTPIIGSPQKSRENPGPKVIGSLCLDLVSHEGDYRIPS